MIFYQDILAMDKMTRVGLSNRSYPAIPVLGVIYYVKKQGSGHVKDLRVYEANKIKFLLAPASTAIADFIDWLSMAIS